EDAALAVAGRAAIGEAGPVPAAEPDHPGRNVVLAKNGVVANRLVEREERVGGALDQERRSLDLVDERARPARAEPVHVLVRDRAGREPREVGARDVRVEIPGPAGGEARSRRRAGA